jgi:ABC-type sugar transport system ATPase subunit
MGSDLHLRAPVPNLPESLLLGIRPEDVKPDPNGKFSGKIALTEPLGVETILHVKSGERTLLSIVPGMSYCCIGEEIRFNITQDKLHCFGKDQKRIGG